jgi:hypothetical protein
MKEIRNEIFYNYKNKIQGGLILFFILLFTTTFSYIFNLYRIWAIFALCEIILLLILVPYLGFFFIIPKCFYIENDGIGFYYLMKNLPKSCPRFISWSKVQNIEKSILVFSNRIQPILDHSLTFLFQNGLKAIMIHNEHQSTIIEAFKEWKSQHHIPDFPLPFGEMQKNASIPRGTLTDKDFRE